MDLQAADSSNVYYTSEMLQFVARLAKSLQPSNNSVNIQVKPVSLGLQLRFRVKPGCLNKLEEAKQTVRADINMTEITEHSVEYCYLLRREPAFSRCALFLQEHWGLDDPMLVARHGVDLPNAKVLTIGSERFNASFVICSRMPPSRTEDGVGEPIAFWPKRVQSYKVWLQMSHFSDQKAIKRLMESLMNDILPWE